MKKEGIQTRNRKMASKSRRLNSSVSRQAIDSSTRRLFDVYDKPSYFHNTMPANNIFSLQSAHETGFYPQATSPQGYTEYNESYQMVPSLSADGGLGYPSTPGRYLSAVTSSQPYLSAAAAGLHRHLHDFL